MHLCTPYAYLLLRLWPKLIFVAVFSWLLVNFVIPKKDLKSLILFVCVYYIALTEL